MFSAKNHGKHDWKINKIVKINRKKPGKPGKKKNREKSKKKSTEKKVEK